MRSAATWLLLNAVLLAANAFAAVIAWAAGSLLLEYGGALADEPWIWYLIGAAMVAGAVGVLHSVHALAIGSRRT